MQNTIYDVLIIGAGPIGLACGIEAKKRNLNYIIIEKGCLVNSLFNYPLGMTFFSTSERLEIGNIPFVSINPKPMRSEALEYYRRASQSSNLNIRLFEEVIEVNKNESFYSIKTLKESYNSTSIVIATGFYGIPIKLNIKGEDLPKVTHYYKEPHFYAGMKVAVIGANNSAVDAAIETYRKGAEVTMIIKGDGIGSRVKYWVKPDIENRIKEKSIIAYNHSQLVEIREKEIDILTPDGIITIQNDFVIAMTGYQPDFNFLSKIGIKLWDDEKLYPDYDKDTQETNLKNIYLAGVVCGGMDTHVWFIENSRVHAETIMDNIEKTISIL